MAGNAALSLAHSMCLLDRGDAKNAPSLLSHRVRRNNEASDVVENQLVCRLSTFLMCIREGCFTMHPS